MTNYKLFAATSLLWLVLSGAVAVAQTDVKKRAPAPAAKKVTPPKKGTTAPVPAPVAAPAPEVKTPEPTKPEPAKPLLAPPSNVLRELDYIVALVNSEPITRSEVLQRQKRLLAQWASQGVTPPTEAEVSKRVLEQLIDERVMLHIARDEGTRVPDGQLNDALLNLARQNQLAGLPELRTSIEADGSNWNSYREEVRAEMIRTQVREREVNARVRVSDREIDQAIQEQSAGAKSAALDINIAQILIALPDNPTAAEVVTARAKADKVWADASKGQDFAKLAEQSSDAGDKTKGGVMGLRSADRYPELFAKGVQNLRQGDVSEILRSDAGFHILKLLERQSASTATVTQSRVRHILLPITDKLNEEQAKVQLRGYKAQIESGRTTFALLARDHSVDGSAAQGGDLGWTTPGLFVPEFERVMNALPTGRVSEPFTSRFGVHILEVMDRKAVAISVREQREAVRNQLREKKSGDAYTLWIADARGRAFVEYKNTAQ